MADKKLLFLTGRLAEPRLPTRWRPRAPEGSWRIDNLGIKVAALMTESDRAEPSEGAARRRSRHRAGPLPHEPRALCRHYGVPFERGPDEIIDLPQFFGQRR